MHSFNLTLLVLHSSNLTLSESYIGMGDNCAILDFSQRHLTGHSWTYLRNFWFCRIFFHAKLPPGTAKTVFENPKGPPFGCWKKKFFKSSFHQSHVMAFGLTIPKWYNTWVLQIFFVNIWSKIFFKIFFPIFGKNIFKKYFQYLSAIPFWNRETECHHMALMKTWFEEIFFSTSKGGTLWIFKNGFCSAGG